MTVVSTAPVVAARVEPASPSAAPADGFAAALAAASRDPASAPSVSLGVMVQAFAGVPTGPLAAAPPAAPAPPAAEPTAGRVPAASATRATPSSGTSAPAGAASSKVIAAAERYLGVPYKWGGTDPSKGLDCSGFVQRALADVGVRLPRVSIDQSKAGKAVASLDQARPGDLVFWYGDGKRPNHIGIYAGDNKMIVAPRTGDVVKYQDISNRTPHVIRRVV